MPLSASRPKPGRRRGLGLGPRIMLMTVSGILILGVCITLVAKYVLEQGAAKSATERVETNMRVAWNVLRESGDKYSIADGKLAFFSNCSMRVFVCASRRNAKLRFVASVGTSKLARFTQ